MAALAFASTANTSGPAAYPGASAVHVAVHMVAQCKVRYKDCDTSMLPVVLSGFLDVGDCSWPKFLLFPIHSVKSTVSHSGVYSSQI